MSPASRPELAALHIGDPPEPWEAIGFAVLGGRRIDVGQVALELGARGSGIVAWSLTGIDSAIREVDGLTTRVADDKPRADGAAHPNGAIGVDHVVVLTPDFERTSDALAGAGMPLRRVRDAGGFRQGFRRLGPVILELVEAQGPTRKTFFWGLVVVVRDLEELAERLGDRVGAIKPAVQPGRRIATLRGSAGVGPALAFMDPPP